MKTHFLNSVVMGLIVGFAVLGCSEKVETEEKKAVVEEEVKEVDPVDAIIADKLRSIIIPRIDFEDRTVEEAIDFIRLRSSEIDPYPDPAKRGLSVVIRRPKNVSAPEAIADANDDLLDDQITSARIPELRLRNVPVTTALRYICIITNLKCEVDESCLSISPKAPNTAWDDVGSLLEEKGDTSVISGKLGQIHIPRIDFENTSIYEAMDFLRLKSAEMENPRTINYVLHLPKNVAIPYIDRLELQDVAIEEVLKQICSKTGMRYELDPYSVILVPKDLK